MKIFNLGRGKGKTTRLLYASEFNNAPIVCSFKTSKRFLVDKARQIGLEIPEPITVSELKNLRGKRIAPRVLIDEAETVLQHLIADASGGAIQEILAITTNKESELLTRNKGE